MLSKGPVGYRVSEVFRIADGLRNGNPQRRIVPADVVEQPRQIFPQMPALGEEQRDDRDVLDSALRHRSHRLRQRRPHHFQKRQFDRRVGMLVAQPLHDAVEGLGPLRSAGAVREQNDRGNHCAVHDEIECSRMCASVADG